MKKFDVVVCVGTYTDRTGAEKKRWKTVGALIEGRDGKPFLTLDRTFNPAGLDVEKGRDSVILSLFEPKEKNEADAF